MNPLLDRFTHPGERRYHSITNADAKQWLLPERGMATALMIYQPSSDKGRLFKRFYPRLKWLPPVRRKLGVEIEYINFNIDILKILEKCFGREAVYSIFLSAPSPTSKIVLQASHGNKLLGYAKIAAIPALGQSFAREAARLDMLRGAGVDSVPRALYHGDVYGGHIFVQSTDKTVHSTTTSTIDKRHIDLITQISATETQNAALPDTNFGADLAFLEQSPLKDSPEIATGIATVREWLAGERTYYLMHGDFTPWNTYITGGRLYTFDLEFATAGYPRYFDLVHFYMQNCLMGHRREPDFAELEGFLSEVESKPRMLITAYLLQITAFYMRYLGPAYLADEMHHKRMAALGRIL